MANASWQQHLLYGTKKLRIEKYFSEAWRGISAHFLTFFLAGVIAMVLSAISFGILSGVLFAGYSMMFIRFFRDRQSPDIEHLFQHFSKFFPLILASLIYFFIGALAAFCTWMSLLAILIIPAIILFALTLYIIPLIVDRNLSLMDAIRESVTMGWERSGLLMSCIFVLILGLMMFIGAKLPYYIGTLIAYPFVTGALSAAYLDLTSITVQARTEAEKMGTQRRGEPAMPTD